MTTEPVKVGDKVMDSITGFIGVATGITEHLYGCNHIIIEPTQRDEKGAIQANRSYDIQRIRVVQRSFMTVTPVPGHIPLGSRVEDIMTLLRGVILSRTVWYFGVVTYAIQPEGLKNGYPGEVEDLEGERLKIIGAMEITVAEEAKSLDIPGATAPGMGETKRMLR